MWAKLKAMPRWAKIVLTCFVVLFIYGATHQPKPHPYYEPIGPGYADHSQYQPQAEVGQSDTLRQYEAEDAQLQSELQQCAADMQETTRQMQQAAISGGAMPMTRPACEGSYPQWIAQEAMVAAQIARLKNGDTRSLRAINGYGDQPGGGAAPSYYNPSTPNYYHPSTPQSDGTGAVEKWDRGAIRGTQLYTDENGEQHELPTADYYYHNTSSGEYVPSSSPTAPADGNNYEPMAPEN